MGLDFLAVHGDGISGEDFFALPDDFFCFEVVGENPGVAAGGGLSAGFGDPDFVLGDDFFVAGLADEVGPFVGILSHVVEFFGAIGVADVTPVFGTDAVVVMVMSGDGGAFTFSVCAFELGEEAEAFEMRRGLRADELAEGGVDVEELGGLL